MGCSRRDDRGYAMAALLVTVAVMGVIIGMALPVWRTVIQREKEEELIFRGRQYARAIQLFQRKYANAYPPSIDVLVEQRFLRKKYKDPMTEKGEFEILYQGTLAQQRAAAMGGGRGQTSPTATPGLAQQAPGGLAPQAASSFGSQAAGPQGGVVGVASKSTKQSIRVYDGRTVYNQWQFTWTPANVVRTGPAGSVGPGQRGMQPGMSRPGSAPGAQQPGAPRGRGAGGPGSMSPRPPG